VAIDPLYYAEGLALVGSDEERSLLAPRFSFLY